MMTKKRSSLVTCLFLTTVFCGIPLYHPLTSGLSGSLFSDEPEVEGVTTEDVVASGEPNDDAFLDQIKTLCDVAIENFVEESPQTLEELVTKARQETKNLLYFLNRNPDVERANNWVNFLLLNELKEALSQPEIDMKVVEKSLSRFNHPENSLSGDFFIQTRQALDAFVKAEARSKTGSAKDDFIYYCEQIQNACRTLLKENPADADASEMIADALENLDQLQINSPNVQEIKDALQVRFAKSNFEIQVSGDLLFPKEGFTFTEPTNVQEIIRGTPTYGKGTVNGTVNTSFVPNDQKAEIAIQLNASIQTKTSAFSHGVTVNSSNNGNVVVTKPIYLDKALTLGRTSSKSNSNSTITGVNTGRGPVGSQFVYDRINQEYPYSKAEAQQLMERKVVRQFDERINSVMEKAGYYNQLISYLQKENYAPRIESRTTDSQLFWNARLGNGYQLGPAVDLPFETDYDLTVKIHQSFLNNPFFTALAGNRLSGEELRNELKRAFPKIDFDELEAKAKEKAATSPSAENAETNGDATDGEANGEEGLSCSEEEKIYLTFSQELPVSVVFDQQQIKVQAKIDLVEQGEKSYSGLDIDVVYQIENRDGEFSLILRETEVWPADLERGATIPARYQVVRNQILKRINSLLPPEIAFKPRPLKKNGLGKLEGDSEETVEADDSIRGSLHIEDFRAEKGWLAIGARFVPVPADPPKTEESITTAKNSCRRVCR